MNTAERHAEKPHKPYFMTRLIDKKTCRELNYSSVLMGWAVERIEDLEGKVKALTGEEG